MLETVLAIEIRVPLIIPFLGGAIILLWAFASGAMAFSGGAGSGLPHIIPPAPPTVVTSEDTRAAMNQRAQNQFRFGQVANFVLAVLALVATVLLVIGMFTA